MSDHVAPVVETEWSPLAPSSTATAIGWEKKRSNKKGPDADNNNRTPSDTNNNKRHCTTCPTVANAEEQETASHAKMIGPLHHTQENRRTDSAATMESPIEIDGVSIEWHDTSATLTFTKQQPFYLCILGRAKIQVLNGEIHLLGYTMDKNSELVEIQSPTWTSAVTLVNGEKNTTVQVHSIRKDGTEYTFRIGDPSHDTVRPTMIPSSWKTAVDSVLNDIAGEKKNEGDTDTNNTANGERHARFVVCGAKHVGKSTCVRYTVHRLLSCSFSAVALLDCDAGQPEMSPPGMLTLTLIHKPLLSPPHHHMVMGQGSQITEQHADACFYGHATSKADPSLFLQCITRLLQSYVQLVEQQYGGDESKLPLIVNTDGWVKGMGLEILSATLDTILPNHVIQLAGEERSKTFDLSGVVNKETTALHKAHSYQSSSVNHEHEVAPIAPIQSSMYRSLRLCTYFLGNASIWDRIEFGQQGIADYECEIGQTLASMKPYVISMDSVQYGIIRGVDNPCDLGSDDVVLDALNGSIVGLCCSATTREGINNDCMSCVGLGLIRSIDREKRLFFVLTPVPLNALQQVDTLVGGSIQVPTECLYRGVHAESFPYLSCDGVSVGIGGEYMKSRNTIMRRQSSL